MSTHFRRKKATNEVDRLYVASGHNPYEAKKRGKKIKLRKDWESIKIQVMREILQQKFAPGTELYNKLKATEDAKLIEGNWWGDKFWGQCNRVGQNWLGRLLMEIRDA